MAIRARQHVAAFLVVSRACCKLWSAYGAVTGGVLILLVNHWLDPVPLSDAPWRTPPPLLVEVVGGALGGAFMGAIVGVIVGILGQFLGGPDGWCLAGALGGGGTVVMLFVGVASRRSGMPVWELLWSVPNVPLAALGFGYLVTGALLGLAVGRAVSSGDSPVPGVRGVVQAIRERSALITAAATAPAAAEVTPCHAPTGRGDELSPLDTHLDGKDQG